MAIAKILQTIDKTWSGLYIDGILIIEDITLNFDTLLQYMDKDTADSIDIDQLIPEDDNYMKMSSTFPKKINELIGKYI